MRSHRRSTFARTALFASLAPLAIACSAHAPDGATPEESAASGMPAGPAPHYNELRWKATHNSYWLNVLKSPADPYASGVQERLVDQTLHEGVRAYELDLHYEGGHSGEFTVYHTDSATSNSGCHYLTDCLDLIHRLDYLEPNHEVVTIVLEFKEGAGADRLFGSNGVLGALKHDHHIEDLDRQLWERLGPRLFTPKELLDRPQCKGLTLRQCVGWNGWPTSDEMRGRYVVAVIGNWADNYWDWIDYANDSGGIGSRAAFPLRSMMTSSVDNMTCNSGTANVAERDKLRGHAYRPEIELNVSSLCNNGNHPYIFDKVDDSTFQNRLLTARDASVFWQIEDRTFEIAEAKIGDDIKNGVKTFLDSKKTGGNVMGNGVARLGDQGGKTFDPAFQLQMLTPPAAGQQGYAAYQMFQTDFPWAFVHSKTPGVTPSMPIPDRPMFQVHDVLPSVAPAFDPAYFDEPGARLYFHARPDGKPVAAFVDVTGDNEWEVQASNTSPSHDGQYPPLAKTDSTGCLTARATTGTDEVRVCRTQESNDRRTVHISGYAIANGVRTDFAADAPHTEPSHTDVGDLLRMQVVSGGTKVNVLTAGTIAPDGTPRWNALKSFTFGKPLFRQGLLAQGDVLFVGAKRNGGYVGKASFTSFGATEDRTRVDDLSHCVNGSCMTAHRPDHVTVSTGGDGAKYVAVHEAYGKVFGGQDRHLYTLDSLEAFTSGLNLAHAPSKFVLRQSAGAQTAALYRCADQRRDYHTHWLSTDASCPKPVPGKGDPQGEAGGVIGYVFTQPLPSTQPLIHMTKGTNNDGSDDTHDHGYAVGQAEADGWKTYGFTQQETVGWVYVAPPPAQPTTLTLDLVDDPTCTGLGLDTVTVSPGGTVCTKNAQTEHVCTVTVTPGATVTLTASAGSMAKFESWSEPGCSGATCALTIPQSKTVKATFCGLIP